MVEEVRGGVLVGIFGWFFFFFFWFMLFFGKGVGL